jgi:hypothetical protein
LAKDETLEPVQFGAAELKTLEEIASQLSACKSASEKSGKAAHVLTVFLKMVDEKMTTFVRELRDRMKPVRAT